MLVYNKHLLVNMHLMNIKVIACKYTNIYIFKGRNVLRPQLLYRNVGTNFTMIRLHIPETFYCYQSGSSYHSLVFSLEGRASHVTGMALAHCILDKFLGVVCHCL